MSLSWCKRTWCRGRFDKSLQVTGIQSIFGYVIKCFKFEAGSHRKPMYGADAVMQLDQLQMFECMKRNTVAVIQFEVPRDRTSPFMAFKA